MFIQGYPRCIVAALPLSAELLQQHRNLRCKGHQIAIAGLQRPKVKNGGTQRIHLGFLMVIFGGLNGE